MRNIDFKKRTFLKYAIYGFPILPVLFKAKVAVGSESFPSNDGFISIRPFLDPKDWLDCNSKKPLKIKFICLLLKGIIFFKM
ncbi:hypothetical protein [Escherichia coli]|uniref:hypothetical protein n=1 Tax=Escherichia coli TaxID=562 RepID=UPI0023D88BF6|nr:hypothetical protein [Escherichia coli]MDF0687534.1 hypothetical protein [Escherichia coli]